ncbi:MAG: nucleoid-associated protein [Hyphomicrobiales bacterium]
MFEFDAVELKGLAIHYVGNQASGEELELSDSLVQLQDETVERLLSHYFLSSFKPEFFYSFFHETDLEMNEIYKYASEVFEDPECLYRQSCNISRHLYGSSNHSRIKSGEVYVAYLENLVIDDELVSGIGIFKSENKETFLKVFPNQDSYGIEKHDGININKLDKGCLIFNTEKDQGYKVIIVDATNKSNESVYWKDAFLGLDFRENDYYQTQSHLNMCQSFVKEVFNEKSGIEKADQIEVLNDSIDYFKSHEEYQKEEFKEEVLKHPEVIEAFDEYQQEYEELLEKPLPESFDISETATKSTQRQFKNSSAIKLDTGFDIYVKGRRENIKKDYDESRGMFCYKIWFNEEKA